MDEYENYEYENGKYLIKLWITKSIRNLDDDKFIDWYINEIKSDFCIEPILKENCKDNPVIEKHKKLLNDISNISKTKISKMKRELIDIINS